MLIEDVADAAVTDVADGPHAADELAELPVYRCSVKMASFAWCAKGSTCERGIAQ